MILRKKFYMLGRKFDKRPCYYTLKYSSISDKQILKTAIERCKIDKHISCYNTQKESRQTNYACLLLLIFNMLRGVISLEIH